MTIEQFLDENTYNLTPAEYNEALGDLESMDKKAWVDKWAPVMMEKAAAWNQVDDVRQAKPLANRIANAFGDVKFAPGKTFKDDVYEAEFSDVPRDQFDAALAKMKEYYDAEVKGRKDEAMRKKREKEVKDWPFWRNVLASDYEKQRYVDKPETALFGKQAPSIGDAPEFRVGATADLLAGVAGAAADVLPGTKGVFLGPAIRSARDAAHILSGSPYQKEGLSPVTDFAADLGVNAGAAWLPNFRRYTRMGKGATKDTPVSIAVELNQMGKAIDNKQANDLYMTLASDGGLTDVHQLSNMINSLPDSPMKQELIANINDMGAIDKGQLADIMEKWRNTYNLRGWDTDKVVERSNVADQMTLRASGASDADLAKWYSEHPYWKPKYQYPTEAGPLREYANKILSEQKPLSNAQKAAAWLLSNANSDVGAAAAKGIASVSGARMSSTPTIAMTGADVEALNEIKDREARFWEAGFAPKKVDGDPLWEAYREWYIERTGDEPGGGAR